MPVIFGTRLGVVMCIVWSVQVGFTIGYLDFGELCADKIVQFFRKNVSEKDKREFEEYKRHCEECREYEQQHANQHDRVERH